MTDFCIWIDNVPITVSEPVYKEYWRGRRKERYFTESDIHNNVFYYDALDTDETNGSDIFSDASCKPVDELVIREFEIEKLYDSLRLLPKMDYALIYKIYFNEESLRSISKEEGIPVSTLHYRHKKILERLRELMYSRDIA